MKKEFVFFGMILMLILFGGCSSESDRVGNLAGGGLEEESILQKSEQATIEWMDNRFDQTMHLDIKPGSCPNPFNPKSKGKLSVALLGSASLRIKDVDVSSILLAGVAPIKSSVEDVSGPATGAEDCDCATDGADGYDDLVLKFLTQDVRGTLGEPVAGDAITLQLTGVMADGSPFSAEDCIVIVGKPAPLDLLSQDSPNAVMANFRTVYENMSLGGLQEVLHPDFMMILQQSTIEEFPDVGSTLDRAEEYRIHERMFSGQHVIDPAGNLVPGVQNISFSRIDALAPWEVAPANDIFPNTLYTLYEIEVLLDRGEGFPPLRIEGRIKFHVKSLDLLYKGKTLSYFQMVGQVDYTARGLKTESVSWGSAKALYR